MKLKKIAVIALSTMLAASCLAGCGNSKSSGGFDTSKTITVMSREDGSGTRGAFVELFGVEQKDENGEKVDHTSDEAIITNSTSVMMTSVAGDTYGIGYISLGSLNDTVKALKIDGAEATVENIKSGSYKISRPFNIATKDNVSEVAQDFIDYIMSSDGQAVIEENGYISVSDASFSEQSASLPGSDADSIEFFLLVSSLAFLAASLAFCASIVFSKIRSASAGFSSR